MVAINEPWALPTLVAGFTGAALGLAVFLQRPGALQNRAAGAFLYTNGLGWALIYGVYVFKDGLVGTYQATYFIWCYAVIAYLFLISSLDTPLTAWLRNTRVRVSFSAALTALSVALVATDVALWGVGRLRFDNIFDSTWALIMFYGIIAAASAWRRSGPGLIRRRNASYALAFIIHDAMVGSFLASIWALILWGVYLPGGPWILALPGIAGLALQSLLVYGILSTQLFDIDLKIRWGLSRGTIGVIFVAGFFAASELVAALLTPGLGVVAGILTTALLIVLLAPLRRASDALAAYLVRDAEDTPAYREHRKELVYQAQVEELMADATISAKERRALLRLQETLGLEAAVAARLERDVLDRLMAPVARPHAELA